MEMTGLFRIPGQNDVVALMQDQFEQSKFVSLLSPHQPLIQTHCML